MTKKPHILVVEDDRWLAEHHVRVLQAAGYGADFVSHAFDAIEAVDTRLPDLMILDVMLAGQNAFTLLHELRSYSDLAHVPIVLCTNSAPDIVAEDAAVYGVIQILDKTIMQPQDVIAAVRKALL